MRTISLLRTLFNRLFVEQNMATQTSSSRPKRLMQGVPIGGNLPPGSAPGGTIPGGPDIPPSGNAGLNRQDFIRNYANLVSRCWAEDSYLRLVLASPAETLAAAGIPTVEGAIIRVIQHKITGSGKIEDQVDAWLLGNETGLYDLFLPMKPEELEIDPGAGGDACAGGDTCCCCPCCCCT